MKDSQIAKLQALLTDKILFVGFGVENRSTYDFLSKLFPEKEYAIADQFDVKNPPEGAKLFIGINYLKDSSAFTTIIRSPGVPLHLLPKDKNITSATKIFFEINEKPIIGVTGTKGKSTTASLITHILKQRGIKTDLYGNIGVPLIDSLANDHTIIVAELSSYQLADLSKSPNIAVILEIAPEHLDLHQGFENYRNAKLNICMHQTDADVLLAHYTMINLPPEVLGRASTKKYFSLSDSAFTQFVFNAGSYIDRQTNSPVLNIAETKLYGEGNATNILAALEVAHLLDISSQDAAEAIKTFDPLPHRLEFVATINDVSFYNDSLSTVPEALKNAIEAFGSNVQTVIVGGYDRGISFEVAGKAIAYSSVQNVIYFPTSGEKILKSALSFAKKPLTHVPVRSMRECVDLAFRLTDKNKICLLSPASPSFGVFKDYADRGEQFKDCINKYKKCS